MSTTFTSKPISGFIVMIVQSLPPLPSGGAEMQAMTLAKSLQQKGLEVIFISPGQGKIRGHSVINGISVYRLHSFLNYFLDMLFAIQKNGPAAKTVIEYDDSQSNNAAIIRKIGIGARLRYNIFLINAFFFLLKRKDQFHILHSHTIEWPGFVAAVLSKWLKKKLVIKDSTMNGISNILRFPSGERKRSLIIGQAHFVAMTTTIRNNLLDAGVTPNKISEIPNGIDISGLYKTAYSDTAKVLFVGNLYQQPAKGVDILLKAWMILIKRYPSALLNIAGDGDLKAYRAYAADKELGKSVKFLGKHNNVLSLMLTSDLLALPSRREGMPNVLMEAMLRGLPCIATDISGSQDLITDGMTGLLVKPSSEEQLAEALYYLLTHKKDAAEMGKSARASILEKYNINSIAERYISLYEEIQ